MREPASSVNMINTAMTTKAETSEESSLPRFIGLIGGRELLCRVLDGGLIRFRPNHKASCPAQGVEFGSSASSGAL